MKKNLLFLTCLVFATVSCVKKPDTDSQIPPPDVNIDHFLTSESYEVPVKAGCISVVTLAGETIAEADSPMTILIPKKSLTKAEGVSTAFVPIDQYPNEFPGNRAHLFQVVCFEDSKSGDFDYNDLVIHVRYQLSKNIFALGVQPVALGSTKAIKLGCVVYKGSKQIFKGLITPEGTDCRSQYFKDQAGFINTVNKKGNFFPKTDSKYPNGGWHEYLGSTIRNWDISKIEGDGAMRVEWYVQVDNGVELFACSTDYLNESFDKNGLPYGLVITSTGSEYTDSQGNKCGYDWFNYPQEATHIKEVYPEIWTWLTTSASFDFSAIYDGRNIPEKAFPASDLKLFEANSIDMTGKQYRVN